jgi:hypothetical protein
VDEVVDLRVVDAQEALNVRSVRGNDRLAQLKDIDILTRLLKGRPPAMLALLWPSRPGVSLECGLDGTACLFRSSAPNAARRVHGRGHWVAAGGMIVGGAVAVMYCTLWCWHAGRMMAEYSRSGVLPTKAEAAHAL